MHAYHHHHRKWWLKKNTYTYISVANESSLHPIKHNWMFGTHVTFVLLVCCLNFCIAVVAFVSFFVHAHFFTSLCVKPQKYKIWNGTRSVCMMFYLNHFSLSLSPSSSYRFLIYANLLALGTTHWNIMCTRYTSVTWKIFSFNLLTTLKANYIIFNLFVFIFFLCWLIHDSWIGLFSCFFFLLLFLLFLFLLVLLLLLHHHRFIFGDAFACYEAPAFSLLKLLLKISL